MNNRAVTLVELLIVIVVMGIIAALAIPALGDTVYNMRVAGVRNDLELIEEAAKYYHIDTGIRPKGTMSGAGTCDSWNNDSRQLFIDGTLNNNPIDGWSGPYVTSWPDETHVGGCYVYRSYDAGNNWGRNNFRRFSDDTLLKEFSPSDVDTEIIMIRFYPLTDEDAFAQRDKLLAKLSESIPENQLLYLPNQAVLAYYILPHE